MSGIDRIATEQKQQIELGGMTPEHNDGYKQKELIKAAVAFACAAIAGNDPIMLEMAMDMWPWDKASFDPRDKFSSLVQAGALIAAEIDRLERSD